MKGSGRIRGARAYELFISVRLPAAPPAREILSEEPRTRGTKVVPSRLIFGRLLILFEWQFCQKSRRRVKEKRLRMRQ